MFSIFKNESSRQHLAKLIELSQSPIKFKLLTSTAKIPTKAHVTDAGFDISADETCIIPPLTRVLVSTGIAVALPNELVYGRIAPRSGLSVKNGINVLAGVVDSGYRGEVKVALYNTDKEESFLVEKGSRIAQMIVTMIMPPVPISVVSGDLDDSDRGGDGFGSTGQ